MQEFFQRLVKRLKEEVEKDEEKVDTVLEELGEEANLTFSVNYWDHL